MATKRSKAEAKPKGGVCEYSGKPTKGGRFKPGNDARLKSVLTNAAIDGNVEAAAELQYRNWPTTGIDRETLSAAAKISRGARADSWFEKRIETRIKKVKAGFDPDAVVENPNTRTKGARKAA